MDAPGPPGLGRQELGAVIPYGCSRAGRGKHEIAPVTDKFHLEHGARGEAAQDDGIFSPVRRKGPQGRNVVLGHTS